MEARVNELFPHEAKIAREFSNIPGLPHAEVKLAAQEASPTLLGFSILPKATSPRLCLCHDL